MFRKLQIRKYVTISGFEICRPKLFSICRYAICGLKFFDGLKTCANPKIHIFLIEIQAYGPDSSLNFAKLIIYKFKCTYTSETFQAFLRTYLCNYNKLQSTLNNKCSKIYRFNHKNLRFAISDLAPKIFWICGLQKKLRFCDQRTGSNKKFAALRK